MLMKIVNKSIVKVFILFLDVWTWLGTVVSTLSHFYSQSYITELVGLESFTLDDMICLPILTGCVFAHSLKGNVEISTVFGDDEVEDQLIFMLVYHVYRSHYCT